MAYNPCGTDLAALLLNDELLTNIFLRGERILGRAVFAAKCSIIARYPTRDTIYGPAVLYTLFGDPALRLKLPPATGWASESVAAPASPVRITILPNPVRQSGTVDCQFPCAGNVSLRLFDAAGKYRMTLADGWVPRGHSVFHLRRNGLPAGIYFLRLQTTAGTGMSQIVFGDPNP